jgi:hypothetical protein
VVGIFLIGCAVLLVVGCSGTSSETSNKKEQGSSPGATVSKEEARCEGTRTTKVPRLDTGDFITNDLPGCPNKGGLLLGTDKEDKLGGKAGDDEIRGLGAKDDIAGGVGNDVIYAGPGNDVFLWDGKGDDITYGGDGDDEFIDDKGDDVLYGGDGDDFFYPNTSGKDVLYGGDGDDFIDVSKDGQPDKFYCGKGKDRYGLEENTPMDKKDYVDSSCEKKVERQVYASL